MPKLLIVLTLILLNQFLISGNCASENKVPYTNPLMIAIEKNRILEIEYFLRKPQLLNAVSEHQTPLTLAARYGNLKLVQRLLKRGANPKLCTPIVEAAHSRSIKIVDLLITHGADINALELLENKSALHVAVCHGDLKTVQHLLKAGANPFSSNFVALLMEFLRSLKQDSLNWTYEEILRELLTYGAVPDQRLRNMESIKKMATVIFDTKRIEELGLMNCELKDLTLLSIGQGNIQSLNYFLQFSYSLLQEYSYQCHLKILIKRNDRKKILYLFCLALLDEKNGIDFLRNALGQLILTFQNRYNVPDDIIEEILNFAYAPVPRWMVSKIIMRISH